jgi:3-deoxy-D-manno-octulosonic-acid transferase
VGGAIQVSGKEELSSELKRLLFDERACTEVGERGFQFLQRHQGATERMVEEVRKGKKEKRGSQNRNS